jgi:hypothetical protein
MTTKEILSILQDTPKCYAGKMSQGRYSRIIHAIKAGTCKQSTLNEFMESFGFKPIDKEQEWKRI